MKDAYYNLPEVSNSDLSWMKKQLVGDYRAEPLEAYKFGSLIDAMITEPEKLRNDPQTNQLTLGEQTYSEEEIDMANLMKNAFLRNPLCRGILHQSKGQAIMKKKCKFDYQGTSFELDTRCKWDLWIPKLGWGADIKSTTATSLKQFKQAVEYFDYDRQRAFYMNIAGSKQDILIGISKKNFEVFVVPIDRQSKLFKQGKEKYEYLAFHYWLMFN